MTTTGDTSPRSQGSTATLASTFRPRTPKMGNLKQESDTSYVPWVGGKPRYDWTALANKPNTIYPTMLRPTSAGSSQKSQAYRTAGLTNKFGHGGNLLEFQGDVLKHFERYGMDTITYVEDPAAAQLMVTIIKHHTKFTEETAKAAVNQVKALYDMYDKANIEDAKIFVENSLEKGLAKELEQVSEGVDDFIEYWMLLMELVRAPTTDHFEKVKARMRSRKIQNYAGEDVVAMCNDLTTDYDELHDASMYDQQISLVVLKSIMEGGGKDNEDFRSELRNLRKELDKKLLETRYDDYDATHKAMVADGLHLPGILRKCKSEYRRVVADGNWPAANHAKDSKALPKGFGSVNYTQAPGNAFELLVNALVCNKDKGSEGGKAEPTCYNCGEKGHFAKACPKKDRRSGKNPRHKQSGPNNGKNRGSGNNPKKRN